VVNLRPGVGELMPKDLGFITGRLATKAIKKGMPLTWHHVGAIK
jgi:sialic acid synthase SpsE